tara:strand:- start:408 stop:1064 length:657 start_codon:yes stop_codon:yes gene_type:complete
MVTKNNQKKSLNASIKEVTNAIDKQAKQFLIKNQTRTPSPSKILTKRLTALQKQRNALNGDTSSMNFSMYKSPSPSFMKTRSQSKSSGSRRTSVGSASTPLTYRQKEMVNVVKRLGFPRRNNIELMGNKLSLKQSQKVKAKNTKGEKRVRIGQEAKNARDAMNLRGLSRRLAARAGAISPLRVIKNKLNFRRSDRIKKNASESPKSKGSVTKKSSSEK